MDVYGTDVTFPSKVLLNIHPKKFTCDGLS